MKAREIRNNVFAVGAVDWDRTLFDALVPLPHGTSYNAYLIKGSEKIALIDTVDPPKWEILKTNLEQLRIEHLDYVVANHAEQDHSGALPFVLEKYPEARVITNAKCKGFLLDLLPLEPERIQVVQDRETLSLGDKTLQFIFAPWVHWPETMLTYLPEDKIMFTCDFFGSHVATSDLFVRDRDLVCQEAKRYYAEIMMPFARSIRKHLETLREFEFDLIAPSHGPIYDDPVYIMQAYQDWVSDEVQNLVVLTYVSMHGSTEKIALHLVEELVGRGITVKPFNLLHADEGELAAAMVDAATVVFATSALLVGPHPKSVYAAYLVNALKPKVKHAAIVASYGWGNKVVDELTAILKNLKVEMLPPLLFKGDPREADFQAAERLADEIYRKHQTLGLV